MGAFVRALSLLLCVLAAAPVAAQGQLTVQGVGARDAAPDMATITVGVTSQDRQAADALEATSAATGEILTLLSEAGIAPEDIQTTDLRLAPVWDQRSSGGAEPPRLAGYRASNNVRFHVRSLGDLGAILDDVVRSGATQFNGLVFGLQDPQPLEDAARQAAVRDALRKAALYADAAGLALGEIVAIQEGGARAPAPVAARQFAQGNSVPIAVGALTLRAEVVVVFALRP